MNQNVTLTKRQKQFIERLARGASYKEVADFFHVSWNTVDNTLRKAKERIGLNKVTELAAWWFCTNYNISFDLSPITRQYIASGCICLFLFGEVAVITNTSYTSGTPKDHVQSIASVDTKLLYINPYIIN
ncbi:LuxR C-terminal-related transcriptional regulator [Bacteroides fragilis]|nr:LuxR C-terminal-related transcriptional regulator [Bacteroides fragilis]